MQIYYSLQLDVFIFTPIVGLFVGTSTCGITLGKFLDVRQIPLGFIEFASTQYEAIND